ncbi:retrovirus-related pol polyprotein from transposon 17.6 [Tanacetum coccineum]
MPQSKLLSVGSSNWRLVRAFFFFLIVVAVFFFIVFVDGKTLWWVKKTLDQQGLVNDVNDTKEPDGVAHVSSLENKEGSLEKNTSKPPSFASILQNNTSNKTVKLQELYNIDCVEGAAVTIPIEAVEEVSARFANTLFGYFIGKRLAFPLVENYVKNTWAKFGLERVMLQNGFFFFQFATKEGMEKVIENGPWLIRLVPLILNVWTPNSKLKKDEITSVPVWIKLHKVPIVAYSEVGLTLVEVSTDNELVDSLVVAIPFPNGKGHSLETIEIEYEWEPPRCSTCKIFDHLDDHCPKKIKEVAPLQANDDGFVEVTRKRVKSKAQPKRQIEGVRLSKPKPNFYYRPKSTHAVGETSSKQANEKSGDKGTNQVTNNMSTTNVSNYGRASSPKELDNQRMPLKNSFAALVDEADPTQPCNEDNEANNLGSDEDKSDCEVMDTIVLEEPRFMGGKMKSNESKGASTPSNDVLNSLMWLALGLIFYVLMSFDLGSGRLMVLAAPKDPESFWDGILTILIFLSLLRTIGYACFLCLHKHYVRNRPWCLLGDFNAALNLADHSAGSSNIDISMREFKDCVEEIEVLDVNLSGLNFTWNLKPKGADGVLKKIDRIMANLEFQDIFIGAHAMTRTGSIIELIEENNDK